MSWKTRHPKVYRLLARLRFALAGERTIELPFGARMRVNPFSYVERLIEAGDFEKRRIEFFRSNIGPGSLFFDIGANVGFFTLLAAAQGARVHAFEPEPVNLRRLRANVDLNAGFAQRVRLWPVALGDQEGEVALGRPLSDNYGRSSLGLGEDCDTVRVRMARFGDFTFEHAEKWFFKIDVEGAEQRVLDGMGAAWEAAVPMVFLVEVHREGGSDLKKIAEIFSSKGFRLSYLDDETGNESPTAPDSGDVALLARRDSDGERPTPHNSMP